MKITRDVVSDLWPLYESGEASADTRALVEEYLRGDPELAERVRRAASGALDASLAGTPSPDLELRTLARTRRRLGWQRWLFGLAWFFTAIDAITMKFFGETSQDVSDTIRPKAKKEKSIARNRGQFLARTAFLTAWKDFIS